MTTNNTTFFMEMQPCGTFFFGSERTFNTAEEDKYKNEITNYFAESNTYPQQTAILGLLRHTLLALYDKLDAPTVLKQAIIGDKNFNGIHEDSFGLIISISPLVIIKKIVDNTREFLLPAPLIEQDQNKLILTEITEGCITNCQKDTTPNLENYDYKEFSTKLKWQNQKGSIEKENIFYKFIKVGVNKNQEEDAFFKQTFYGLCKCFSFGVWIKLHGSLNPDYLKSIIMPFGADQGIFKINFNNNIPSIFENDQQPTQCLYLISDSYVDEKLISDIDYAITEYTDFRYIKSKTNNYYKLRNKSAEGESDKSNKMRLMKRGSVIFSKKADAIASRLEKNLAFRNIGYNYFKFI